MKPSIEHIAETAMVVSLECKGKKPPLPFVAQRVARLFKIAGRAKRYELRICNDCAFSEREREGKYPGRKRIIVEINAIGSQLGVELAYSTDPRSYHISVATRVTKSSNTFESEYWGVW